MYSWENIFLKKIRTAKQTTCFSISPRVLILFSSFPGSLLFFPFLSMQLDFLVAQMVKRLPTMRETWVQSLGWEDLLEKEMATHSSILAWKIWTEEPIRLQSMGLQRVRLD